MIALAILIFSHTPEGLDRVAYYQGWAGQQSHEMFDAYQYNEYGVCANGDWQRRRADNNGVLAFSVLGPAHIAVMLVGPHVPPTQVEVADWRLVE